MIRDVRRLPMSRRFTTDELALAGVLVVLLTIDLVWTRWWLLAAATVVTVALIGVMLVRDARAGRWSLRPRD
jgi:fatty acid desaturase